MKKYTIIRLIGLINIIFCLNIFGAEIDSKITDVTLYADRARVIRKADVTVSNGITWHKFTRLPGWIDTGSIRVAILPESAGELVDIKISQKYLIESDDENIRKVEKELELLQDKMTALEDKIRTLNLKTDHVNSMKAFSLDKLPKDFAHREVKVSEYSSVIDFISKSISSINTEKRKLEKEKRHLRPELDAKRKELYELNQHSRLVQKSVNVGIRAAGNTSAGLSLTYMLPGASWEPVHDLKVDKAGKNITLLSYAVISQTSGEDWDDVNIHLSTQRPDTTMRIPDLESLLVDESRESSTLPGLQVSQNTFDDALLNFKGQNQIWNEMHFANDNSALNAYKGNMAVQQETQKRVGRVFKKLQGRGTTTIFSAEEKQSIRTDGESVRVLLDLKKLPAKRKYLAVPELVLNAVSLVNVVNSGKVPLLPGKVLLYKEGAFLGTTEIDFVASGETFDLFTGMADEIKISRVLDKKRSSLVKAGRYKKMQISYLVTLENLSDRDISLKLKDRIPVSENEEIKVNNIKIEPDTEYNNKGILTWDAELKPGEKKLYRLEYTVNYPSYLNLNKREKSKSEDKFEDDSYEMYRSAPVEQQLMEMESLF